MEHGSAAFEGNVTPLGQGGGLSAETIFFVVVVGGGGFFLFCFFVFFGVPQLYLWGSPLLGEIFAYVTGFF